MSKNADLSATVGEAVEILIVNAVEDASPTTVITRTNNVLVEKQKGLQFNNAINILLLLSVMLVDAHTARHRTMKKCFEKWCTEIMKSAPTSSSDN